MRVCKHVVKIIRSERAREPEIVDLHGVRPIAENALPFAPNMAVQVDRDVDLSFSYGRGRLSIVEKRDVDDFTDRPVDPAANFAVVVPPVIEGIRLETSFVVVFKGPCYQDRGRVLPEFACCVADSNPGIFITRSCPKPDS